MRSSRELTWWIVLMALAVQTGCAHTVKPPPLPPEQLKSEMGAVGVAGAPYTPETDFSRPIQSKPLAALAGMGGGLAVGVGSGAICFITVGYAWPFCAVAIWTPGMMVTGIVEGANKGVTIAEVKAGTEALREASVDPDVQDTLRDAVIRTALERASERSMVAVSRAGLSAPEEARSYTDLAADHLDTVVEVGMVRIQLRRADKAKARASYGPSVSFESWMDPKLELVVEARARLIRVRDGFVLFSRPYDHVGSSHTFMEWTREGARVYRDARAATLEKLGAAIAADFLGPFPPPEVAPTEPPPECLGPDPT